MHMHGLCFHVATGFLRSTVTGLKGDLLEKLQFFPFRFEPLSQCYWDWWGGGGEKIWFCLWKECWRGHGEPGPSSPSENTAYHFFFFFYTFVSVNLENSHTEFQLIPYLHLVVHRFPSHLHIIYLIMYCPIRVPRGVCFLLSLLCSCVVHADCIFPLRARSVIGMVSWAQQKNEAILLCVIILRTPRSFLR